MLDERRLISVNRSFYNPKSGEQYYVVLICNLDGLKSLLKKVAGQGEHLLLVESGGEIFMSEGTSTDGNLAISADKADCLEHISASGFWTVKGAVKKEAGK